MNNTPTVTDSSEVLKNLQKFDLPTNLKFTCVFGTSGAGKTSIVMNLLEYLGYFKKAITCATRKIRPNEVDGVDYYFLTVEQFKEKIEAGDFIEYEEVYENSFRGITKQEFHRLLNDGYDIIHVCEPNGANTLYNLFKDRVTMVYVDAMPKECLPKPGIPWNSAECTDTSILFDRLILRGESEAKADERMARVPLERKFLGEFMQNNPCHIINNVGPMGSAVQKLQQIVADYADR